jgi:multimeric flavodoxin WrbA
MAKLIGISGSLRKCSFNAALLRAAAELAPAGTAVEIASIAGIPLYDGDLESAQGIPPPVATLKDQIAAADGLLLVTPEYNNSLPGVFKNAIDWLSRPASDIDRVFGNKPVALLGATPGMGGTGWRSPRGCRSCARSGRARGRAISSMSPERDRCSTPRENSPTRRSGSACRSSWAASSRS